MSYIQDNVSQLLKQMDTVKLRNDTLQITSAATISVSWKNTPLCEPIHQNKPPKETKYTNNPQTPKMHRCILIATGKSEVENTLCRGRDLFTSFQSFSQHPYQVKYTPVEDPISTVLWISIYTICSYIHDDLENKSSTFVECKWE
jgi:hypothetical protein